MMPGRSLAEVVSMSGAVFESWQGLMSFMTLVSIDTVCRTSLLFVRVSYLAI